MCRLSIIWSEEKESFLKKNYATTTNCKLASTLGVSIPSVKNKARELGLKKSYARRKITPALEALALRMSAKNSYRSVADKLNISLSSVNNIVNEAVEKGYEKRSQQETRKIMSDIRVKTIKTERARAIFGLNQKTKLKVFPNKQKYYMRDRLKRCRYDVDRNSMDIYIDDETRRHANMESEAKKLGFNIQKDIVTYLPMDFVFENGAAEEQIAAELQGSKNKTYNF
jgi:DNA-binding CsgD family transcriptional regulator